MNQAFSSKVLSSHEFGAAGCEAVALPRCNHGFLFWAEPGISCQHSGGAKPPPHIERQSRQHKHKRTF